MKRSGPAQVLERLCMKRSSRFIRAGSKSRVETVLCRGVNCTVVSMMSPKARLHGQKTAASDMRAGINNRAASAKSGLWEKGFMEIRIS